VVRKAGGDAADSWGQSTGRTERQPATKNRKHKRQANKKRTQQKTQRKAPKNGGGRGRGGGEVNREQRDRTANPAMLTDNSECWLSLTASSVPLSSGDAVTQCCRRRSLTNVHTVASSFPLPVYPHTYNCPSQPSVSENIPRTPPNRPTDRQTLVAAARDVASTVRVDLQTVRSVL